MEENISKLRKMEYFVNVDEVVQNIKQSKPLVFNYSLLISKHS